MDTIIFDLDDTLHDDTTTSKNAALAVAQYVADRYGVDSEALAGAYIKHAESFWIHLTAKELSSAFEGARLRFWGLALIEFGIRDRELSAWCAFAYGELRDRQLHVFPGVHEMLAQLRREGLKLALLTNGFARSHRTKIQQLGLHEAFDGFFLADEVGMVKPDPRIFLHVCEQLGTTASRAVMVGDRYDRDIVGAHDAGLYTIWVNARQEVLPVEARPPHAMVIDVLEMPLVLRENAQST